MECGAEFSKKEPIVNSLCQPLYKRYIPIVPPINDFATLASFSWRT